MRIKFLGFLYTFILLCIFSAAAQNYNPSLSLGVQGISSQAGNVGMNGTLQALWRTTNEEYETPNYWVATIKATRLKVGEGSFFSVLKKDGANLSILSIMGGYRFAIGKANYLQLPFNPPNQGAYISSDIGLAFVGLQKISPTITFNLGYFVSQNVEFNISSQYFQGINGSVLVVGVGGAIMF